MIKNIKDLAREVERQAIEKGYTSIEPSIDLLEIKKNDTESSVLEFVLKKDNKFSGRASLVVKNMSVKDQTVEQLTNINWR